MNKWEIWFLWEKLIQVYCRISESCRILTVCFKQHFVKNYYILSLIHIELETIQLAFLHNIYKQIFLGQLHMCILFGIQFLLILCKFTSGTQVPLISHSLALVSALHNWNLPLKYTHKTNLREQIYFNHSHTFSKDFPKYIRFSSSCPFYLFDVVIHGC